MLVAMKIFHSCWKRTSKEFVEKLDSLALTSEELEERKLALEDDIERKLKALNQSLHDEQNILVGKRVQLCGWYDYGWTWSRWCTTSSY